MGDTEDQNDDNPIPDLVDDPIIANPDAPELFPAPELLGSWRARAGRERVDPQTQPGLNLTCEFAKVARSTGRELDDVGHWAARRVQGPFLAASTESSPYA